MSTGTMIFATIGSLISVALAVYGWKKSRQQP